MYVINLCNTRVSLFWNEWQKILKLSKFVLDVPVHLKRICLLFLEVSFVTLIFTWNQQSVEIFKLINSSEQNVWQF